MTTPEVAAAFGVATTTVSDERFVLRLYVAGSTFRAARMITQVRAACEEHLAGRYDLEVVDLHQDTDGADADDVVAAPMLLRRLPLPVRRVIGEIADEQLLVILGVEAADRPSD